MRSKLAASAAAVLCACALAFAGVNAAGAPGDPAQPSPATASAGGMQTTGDAGQAGDDRASARSAETGAYEPGAFLATLAEGATPEQALDELATVAGLDGLSVSKVVSDGVLKLALPEGASVPEAVAAAKAASTISAAQPNRYYYVQETSGGIVAAAIASVQAVVADDPYYATQWELSSVKAPEAWEKALAASASTEPVTVAVIDAGFYVDHEDFADGNASNIAGCYDAVTGQESIKADNPEQDQIDHGTHAAGIVAARTNNGKGVASASYNLCNVLPIRVQDGIGKIKDEYLIAAYDYLIARAKGEGAYANRKLNIRVVNMSLGGASPTPVTRADWPELYDKISEARRAGIVTVVAACNSGTEGPESAYSDEIVGYMPPFYAYPSDFDNVVSVMALGQTSKKSVDNGVDRIASSNYNMPDQKDKNISAPGQKIYGLYGSASKYKDKTGTSMASPLVASVLALMFRVNPALTADEAVEKLYGTARDLTQGDGMSKGWDVGSGYGEVDAAAAIAAVAPQQESGGDSGSEPEDPPADNPGDNPSDNPGDNPSDNPSDTPSDQPSDNPGDQPADKPADPPADKPTDKPSDTPASVALSDCTVTVAASTYNGAEQTPSITVTYRASGQSSAITLASGSDYTVEKPAGVARIVNAGTYDFTVKAVDGSGYTGSKTASFTVEPAPLSKCEATAQSATYTGSVLTPAVTVKDGATTLGKGADYTVASSRIVNAGTHEVTINAVERGNYSGSVTAVFTVAPASLSKCTVAVQGATYNGSAITPAVTVKNGSTTLGKGSDYTVEVAGAPEVTSAGTHAVTVRAVNGGNYTGTATGSFVVNPVDISKASIAVDRTKFDYTGKLIRPALRSVTAMVGGVATRLVANTDYKLSNPGVKKGTGKVTVTGKGNFKGKATKSYSVTVKKVKVQALYHKATQQWFYTDSQWLIASLKRSGWQGKGVAWTAPQKSAKPIYCYKSSGKYLYSNSPASLGVAFYSDDSKTRPVFTYYNAKTKAYRYTTSKLNSPGWKRKATRFYAL